MLALLGAASARTVPAVRSVERRALLGVEHRDLAMRELLPNMQPVDVTPAVVGIGR